MGNDGWQAWRRGIPSLLPGLDPVIGHRGAAARAPENTLAGLRKAHALGAGWVEFDVMLTADRVPVLIHDETLERTTNGRGEVAAHTAAEIAELDAGSWFAPGFAGERVPALAEAIALLLALGLGANVEIKPAAGRETVTGEVVAACLRQHWPQDGPGLLLSSFERPALAAAARVAPDLPRGLLAEDLPQDWEAELGQLGCTTLHLDHTRIDPMRMRELAGEGVPVLLYTVNDPVRARDLRAAGATAIITDVPDLLLAAQ
ncbi:MAG: glycerophosphodiester phosphodiesterase [Geminicoccaceae bacterium]